MVMANVKAQDNGSVPAVGKITSVEEAVKLFGPEFVSDLAKLLAPQIQPLLAQGNVRKVYEIEPYTGSHEVIEHVRVELLDPEGQPVIDEKSGKKKYHFIEKKRMVSGGYMVYLPQGHSVYVESQEQLNRLRLNNPSGMVDMNTGLHVGEEAESIKSHVTRNTQHTPRARRIADGSLAGNIDSVISTLE